MVQRYIIFACATQNHTIIIRNSLIFILRYMMANKNDEVRKRARYKDTINTNRQSVIMRYYTLY